MLELQKPMIDSPFRQRVAPQAAAINHTLISPAIRHFLLAPSSCEIRFMIHASQVLETPLLFNNRHRHLNPLVRQVMIVFGHAHDPIGDA